jgi:FkbM family methyltransferase
MNCSAIPNDRPYGRLLRLPLSLIPREFPVPVLQGKLRGRRWIVGSATHGCWLGSYEYAKRRLFERTVTPGAVVFDVGANVGFYTLLASLLVGTRGSVYAFEPVPRNLAYLRRHLDLNHVANVVLIEAAVSNRTGWASFQEGANSSTGCLADEGDLRVQLVTLDDLVERGEIPAPAYIKMDIEGGELDALLGARQILESRHPTIFLATHSAELHQACCSLLMSFGYQLGTIGAGALNESDEILGVHPSAH